MTYPVYKTIYLPYIKQENSIIISNSEESFQLNNENDCISLIIDKLNGEHNLNDLCNDLNLDEDFSQSLLEFLTENSFLEYYSKEQFNYLTSDENRYKSNFLFYNNYSNKDVSSIDIHNRIRNKTVLLLGLGGASNIAAILSGMGIGRIIGVDFDTVELSNLSRQFLFSEHDVGQDKTDITYKSINNINSEVETLFYNQKITSIDDLEKILSSNNIDFIVNGIDTPNIISSRWVNFVAKKYKIPFIQGGVSKTNIMIECYYPNSGCFDCGVLYHGNKNGDYITSFTEHYGRDSKLQNVSYAPYISYLAGLLTHYIAQYFLSESSFKSFSLNIDIKNINEKDTYLFNPNKDCPTCYSKENDICSLNELINKIMKI